MSVTLRRLMNGPLPLARCALGRRRPAGVLLLLLACCACVAPERKPPQEGDSAYFQWCRWRYDTLQREMGFVIEYEAGRECWCGKPIPEHAYARPPALEQPSWYGRRAKASA